MTSNFCKTSWHPYGHTPEEVPDCQLCHESKIPKKLEFKPHLTTGVIARDRDMEMLVLWLNELRDYLQAKEEASKGECKCGCWNCPHEWNLDHSCNPPEHEESIEDKYYELIMEVGKKYPGETRHQTALRYIRQAENNNNKPAKAGLGD